MKEILIIVPTNAEIRHYDHEMSRVGIKANIALDGTVTEKQLVASDIVVKKEYCNDSVLWNFTTSEVAPMKVCVDFNSMAALIVLKTILKSMIDGEFNPELKP